MTKKVCSISGGEYDEGSFSDIIHQYIEAPTKAEFDKVKQEILLPNRLQELQYWSQGLLSEFRTVSRHPLALLQQHEKGKVGKEVQHA